MGKAEERTSKAETLFMRKKSLKALLLGKQGTMP
jgi:hypothetical protein